MLSAVTFFSKGVQQTGIYARMLVIRMSRSFGEKGMVDIVTR